MEKFWKQVSIPDYIQLYLDQLQLWTSPLAAKLDSIPRWGWVCGGLLGACVCFKVHYDVTYGVWKRQGVDGPTPLPFTGNVLETVVNSKDIFETFVYFSKTYGQKGFFGLVKMSIF